GPGDVSETAPACQVGCDSSPPPRATIMITVVRPSTTASTAPSSRPVRRRAGMARGRSICTDPTAPHTGPTALHTGGLPHCTTGGRRAMCGQAVGAGTVGAGQGACGRGGRGSGGCACSGPTAPRLAFARRSASEVCAMDEVLARSGIFQGVDPEAAEALSKEMETVEFRKGEVVFSEGEPGDSLYIVLSGKLKLGRRAADGRQNLIAVMGPSDMVGELSLFDPGPRTATATAVVDTKLA